MRSRRRCHEVASEESELSLPIAFAQGGDEMLVVLLEMVEDMEERELRFGSCDFLNVVNDEHVHGLIEVNEIV